MNEYDDNTAWFTQLHQRNKDALTALTTMCTNFSHLCMRERRPDLVSTLDPCITYVIEDTLDVIDNLCEGIAYKYVPSPEMSIRAYVQTHIHHQCQLHLVKERDDAMCEYVLQLATQASQQFWKTHAYNRTSQEIDDNAYDTLIKVLEKVDEQRFKITSSFEGYIKRMARYTYIDKLRDDDKYGNPRSLPEDYHLMSAEIEALENASPHTTHGVDAAVIDCIDRITASTRSAERNRTLLILKLNHELFPDEIAEQLGITRENVNTIWYRLKPLLIRCLQSKGIEPGSLPD